MLNATLRGLALAAIAATPALAAEPVVTEAHLAAVDVDADGKVSLAEYRIALSDAFLLLDTDADGFLAPADLAGILDAAQVASVDADGDGRLSWAEFDARIRADFATADRDGNGSLE